MAITIGSPPWECNSRYSKGNMLLVRDDTGRRTVYKCIENHYTTKENAPGTEQFMNYWVVYQTDDDKNKVVYPPMPPPNSNAAK